MSIHDSSEDEFSSFGIICGKTGLIDAVLFSFGCVESGVNR